MGRPHGYPTNTLRVYAPWGRPEPGREGGSEPVRTLRMTGGLPLDQLPEKDRSRSRKSNTARSNLR